MTQAADRILTDAAVHPQAREDEVHEAIAVRDGRVVRVGRADDVGLLAGVETDVIECGGRVVLPGFVDAHTHLQSTGRYLLFADLSDADTRGAALEPLGEADARHAGWHVGVGYDESTWSESILLDREDLDAVSMEAPVAAFRVDMHTASLNSVALEHLEDRLPEAYVTTEAGRPTGVVREDAVGVVRSAIGDGRDLTRDLLEAAQHHALSLGITCVHDLVRGTSVPATYHRMHRDGDLDLRVRLNYWRDHLDAVTDLGLVTGHGDGRLYLGAIKSFTDGSIGAHTAKLEEPYADAEDRGTWVVEPETLAATVERADGADLQLAVHAIGDAAIETALSAFEATPEPGGARHRIEHVELATDDHIERLADAGVVASMQPNFHRWAGEGGLYERRLGAARTRRTNRFRAMADAGVHLAFGSDSMPIGPLYGVHHAVNAPHPSQRLTVDEALHAYTAGGAYAGFDEDRLGTLEVGTAADLVVLEDSPWAQPDAIEDIDVRLTLVDGDVVHDRSGA